MYCTLYWSFCVIYIVLKDIFICTYICLSCKETIVVYPAGFMIFFIVLFIRISVCWCCVLILDINFICVDVIYFQDIVVLIALNATIDNLASN